MACSLGSTQLLYIVHYVFAWMDGWIDVRLTMCMVYFPTRLSVERHLLNLFICTMLPCLCVCCVRASVCSLISKQLVVVVHVVKVKTPLIR